MLINRGRAPLRRGCCCCKPRLQREPGDSSATSGTGSGNTGEEGEPREPSRAVPKSLISVLVSQRLWVSPVPVLMSQDLWVSPIPLCHRGFECPMIPFPVSQGLWVSPVLVLTSQGLWVSPVSCVTGALGATTPCPLCHRGSGCPRFPCVTPSLSASCLCPVSHPLWLSPVSRSAHSTERSLSKVPRWLRQFPSAT